MVLRPKRNFNVSVELFFLSIWICILCVNCWQFFFREYSSSPYLYMLNLDSLSYLSFPLFDGVCFTAYATKKLMCTMNCLYFVLSSFWFISIFNCAYCPACVRFQSFRFSTGLIVALKNQCMHWTCYNQPNNQTVLLYTALCFESPVFVLMLILNLFM